MNDLNYIRENIGKIPRLKLVNLPTPLEKLNNLSKNLKGPNIYMKRDDIIGGNKMRKLEFLAADALKNNKKKIVTFGAVGSNHTRETSVVCNKLGLKPVIFVTGNKKNIKKQGNFLLNTILGAEIKIMDPIEAPFTEKGPDTIEKLSDALIKQIPEIYRKEDYYIIPVGGYTPLGSMGYLLSALEIYEQSKINNINIDYVITAVGTTGTFTGLLYGLSLINKIENKDIKLIGFSVTGSQKNSYKGIIKRCNKMGDMMSFPIEIKASEIEIIDDFFEPGYGIPSKGGIEAIKKVAQTEGIFLDPVYTGKAMDGLLDCINNKAFSKDDNIVFMHTGGFPSIFTFNKYF